MRIHKQPTDNSDASAASRSNTCARLCVSRAYRTFTSVLLSFVMMVGLLTPIPVLASGTDDTATVKDILTVSDTGATSTSYVNWTAQSGDGHTGIQSEAVYSGQTAETESAVQMRSKNHNSGIVSVESGGYARKIKITWAYFNADRYVAVYGSNTPYSSPEDLYNAETAGTELVRLSYYESRFDTVSGLDISEFTVEDDYRYIGLRSTYGALYLTQIEINWEEYKICPEWEWASDFSSASATFTDEQGVSNVVQAEVTSKVTKQPTYLSEGVRTYTAAVTYEGSVYSDSQTEAISQLVFGGTVDYVEADGTPKTSPEGTVLLTGSESVSELSTGWYAVTEDITYEEYINVSGDVKIILCDGATAELETWGFYLKNTGDRLTIYGQEEGSGRLLGSLNPKYEYNVCNIIGENTDADTVVTVNGGTIECDEDNYCDLYAYDFILNGGTIKNCTIDTNNSITINGGEISLYNYWDQFYSPKVTINGGSVDIDSGTSAIHTATFVFNGGNLRSIGNYGGVYADYSGSSVTLSWSSPSDSIYVDKYWRTVSDGHGGATFVNRTVTLEKQFVDGNGNKYPAGDYSNGELNEKTLYPDFDGWNDLQQRINEADSGDTVNLICSCKAAADDTALVIPSGKELTIDLKGFSIDRGLAGKQAVEGGNVITNNGILTIKDSSGNKSGKITGGNNTGNGGGIISDNYYTFTLESGSITGNKSGGSGGGIWGSGWVVIKDGSVTGNVAAENGGGIFLKNYHENKIKVAGSPDISGNTKPDGTKSDVFITSQVIIYPIDLSSDARIGVSVANNTDQRTLTSGLSGNGSETNFFSDSDSYVVILNSKSEAVLVRPFVFHFDPNGGSGEMDDIIVNEAKVTLPYCTFTPPEGKKFKAWSDGVTSNEYPYDEELTISAAFSYEYTISPIWADVYDVDIADCGHGSVAANKSEAIQGEIVKVAVLPDDGYYLDSLIVTYGDGQTVQVNYGRFYMPAGDVTVTAVFTSLGDQLAGHSISLDGDIAVNYYMELSDRILNSANDPYMQFTVPGTSGEYQSQKVYVKDITPKTVGGRVYYIFKCRVAAKDMDTEIQAQLIDGTDKGTVYTYSVSEYAHYLLDNAYTDETMTTVKNQDYADAYDLVTAMLRYGDYANAFFDDSVETVEPVDLGSLAIPQKAHTEDLPAGVSLEGSTLSLKSQVTLSLYFKSKKELTLSCSGREFEVAHSGSQYVIRIRNIAAKELADDFTVSVAAAGESGTVTYSPMIYCFQAAASDDVKLANVAKALYLYWYQADLYFGDRQGD